jgi:glycosyltransferase involved in cell wall biosynthesis
LTRVTVLTHIVTPYQVELFDAVRRAGRLDIRTIYLSDSRAHRGWQPPELDHPAVELATAGPAGMATAQRWVEEGDLVVVGHYRNEAALRWIDERERGGRAWCLWGEKPGFRSSGIAGRAFRAWKLRTLARSKAPIWGIGSWAVQGWSREFGRGRRYFNVPYFSDITRFSRAAADRRHGPSGAPRFLFSGSLIKRKGVDLLARAFARLASRNAGVTLDVVGSGALRGAVERTLAGCSDRVAFHGFQQWGDLPSFYARADVLCVPSRYDGWGLVIPEGLASGMPVIATDRMGAAVDLMTAGENGWIARAGDLGSLERALEAMAGVSGAEMARFSDAAIQSVARHHLAHGVSQFENAVVGTLAQWSGPPDPTLAGGPTGSGPL